MNNIHTSDRNIPESKVHALRSVGPHFEVFVDSVHEAFERVHSIPAEIRSDFDKRALACDRWCLMTRIAERKLKGIANIQPAWKYGVLYLVIDNRFRVRFKKLDPDFRPIAYPTGQTDAFMGQEQFLPGFEIWNLIVGYRLDKFGILAGIYLTCPKGKRNLWIHEIHDERAAHRLVLMESIPTQSKLKKDQTRRVANDNTDPAN